MKIETFEVSDKIVEIHSDDEPQNPREDDNADTMVYFHKRYQLGDKHNYKSGDFSSWDKMEDKIKKDNDILEIMPLYLYDHSGITISVASFNDRWDSGQVGFIFMTKQQARSNYMVKRITKDIAKKAHGLMLADVEVYDQYLRGDCYGYIIKNKETDDELDSCWGFWGIDYVKKEATSAAENIEIVPKENPNQIQLQLA